MKNIFTFILILFTFVGFSQGMDEMDPSYVKPKPQSEITNGTTYNKAQDDGIIKKVLRLNFGNSNYSEFDEEGFTVFSAGLYADIPMKINDYSSLDFNYGVGFISAIADDWELTNNIDEVAIMQINIGLGYGYYFSKYLKISTGIGYSYEFGSYYDNNYDDDYDYDYDLVNKSAFYYTANVDWFITPKFGLNLRYDTFQSLSFGMQWKIGQSK